MTLTTLWLFIVMTFFVSATPGPNMLFIMSIAARHGMRVAVAGMAGCMTALMLMMGISAAGLGALLQTFPTVFDALRLLGAAYLAYLGVQVWRAPVGDGSAATPDAQTPAPATSAHTAAVYRQAFLVAGSNPKAILFAAAFFPQFINPQAAQLPQFAILLTTFAVIEISWYCIYAASGKRLSAYLQRPSVLRAFNRATGGVFVGFAALMALAKE
jgi:threonine/homoserine/homoserine lactone efflux protein